MRRIVYFLFMLTAIAILAQSQIKPVEKCQICGKPKSLCQGHPKAKCKICGKPLDKCPGHSPKPEKNRQKELYYNVVFSCNVSGAEMFVDGILRESPNTVIRLSKGLHSAELHADGYEDLYLVYDVTEDMDIHSEMIIKSEIIYKVNDVSFRMIYVEGGTFKMGATEEQCVTEEYKHHQLPIHQVTLNSFYLCEFEVTQELWTEVLGNNPSHYSGNPINPVENVSWEDCQSFIDKLNELIGETFRLPTEAEWEFAARGGNKSKGCRYAGSNNLENVGWSAIDSYQTRDNVVGFTQDFCTHTVGSKNPNELGLYDMSGNVEEWCSDWYSEYDSKAQINPTGPPYGKYRVIRGGSFDTLSKFCNVSSRSYSGSYESDKRVGFRLAMNSKVK